MGYIPCLSTDLTEIFTRVFFWTKKNIYMKFEADFLNSRGLFRHHTGLKGSLGGSDGLFSVFVNQFNLNFYQSPFFGVNRIYMKSKVDMMK